MVCKVEIKGRQVEVLIDSGSEVSLLKTTAFEEFETDIRRLKNSHLTSIQANRQKMELTRMVHLPIEAGEIKNWSKLFSAPDLEQTMILGKD